MYGALVTGRSEIRVLDLHPGPQDDTIRCSLRQVSLDSSPQYKALSYTWGNVAQTRPILVDGQRFEATVNLASALSHLRSQTDVLTIWVDAVCINQQNNSEVNDQVRRMKSIYNSAERVIVWLGEEQPEDAAAIALIKEIFDNIDSDEWFAAVLQDSATPAKIMAVSSILARDYWSRAWVVQETMFNKDITVHCGALTIPWRSLDFSGIIEKRGEDLAKLDVDSASVFRNGGAGTLGDPGIGGITSPSDLLRTLIWNRQLYATDPRDKVYAFTGLLDACCPQFPIDYSRSVEEVYIDVVKYLLIETRRLDVIGVTQSMSKPPKLPSWAPDWRHQPDSTSVNLTRLRAMDPVFCASDLRPARYMFSDNDRTLTVAGFVVGVVEHLGAACLTESLDETSANKYAALAAFQDWYKLVARCKGTGVQAIVDMCRVTSCDYVCSSNASGLVNRSPLTNAEEEVTFFLAVAVEQASAEAFPGELLRFNKRQLGLNEGNILNPHSSETGATFMQDRRFFISSGGHMGLAPQHARIGDSVCVLLGCSQPIILRDHKDYHTVIGESFIHGLMYGEWLSSGTAGQQRMFDLR